MENESERRWRAASVAAGTFLLLLINGGYGWSQRSFPMPPVDVGEQMLEVRAWAQRQSAERFDVYHDFAFTDRREESGITFEHQVVADAAKLYKPNHYDHGNGIVVADVDGDGLYDIYFVTQLGRNELWKNLGNGRFRDITEQAGIGVADRVSVTASFADYDNDGDPDLFVTTVRMGNVLFENDGAGRFTDVTERAGLSYDGHSSGATFFDYDLDGDLDLFLCNVGQYTGDERGPGGYWVGFADAFSGHLKDERTEHSILYQNQGDGTFLDVSRAAGLLDAGWSGDASFTDFDGDLYPDLYVVNMQGDDHYYENRGGESFVDRTPEVFPETPWGTMGIKFFDWNNDGRSDLMLTDMHSDMSRDVTPGFEKLKSFMAWTDAHLGGGGNNIFGNAFYENQGDGEFREISDEIGAENYWPWGLSVGDLNADGWEDVFIASSMNFPYRYGVNSVLLNNRGQAFLDSEFILGVEPRKGPLKKPWFELDCTGPDRGHQLCQAGPGGAFTVLASVGSRSSVIFDLDQDGDLDIVTNEFNGHPQLLVSDLAQRTEVRFVEIKLVGTESNRDGLGARVEVRTPAGTYTKLHDGKSGYLSQSSSLPLYFGTGEAATIDSIEVAWPSGRRQTVREGISVGSRIEIVEE